MKLSIIVVSYNEKQYISEAIDSCLNQKFPYDYEIIIGDDGSDDGSIEVIKEYKIRNPERIRYFIMDRSDIKDLIPSIRVSNVLKTAFGIAKGEFIVITSGDDIIIGKDRLRKQIEFLERNSNYASCYTDYVRFGDNYPEEVYEKRCSLSNSVFWAYEYVHIGCFVYRKETLLKLLDRFIDDTGLAIILLSAGKTKHINCVGYGYRQRDKSIMHESDYLELCVVELMLYQDVLNYGGYKKSSLARFSIPLKYAYEHREKLDGPKYKKYIENCKKYDNDIINGIIRKDCIKDDIRMKILVYKAQIYRKIFKVLGIIEEKLICW